MRSSFKPNPGWRVFFFRRGEYTRRRREARSAVSCAARELAHTPMRCKRPVPGEGVTSEAKRLKLTPAPARPAKLLRTYAQSLALLQKEAVLVAKGAFAFIFLMRLDARTRIALKVPRVDPDRRMVVRLPDLNDPVPPLLAPPPLGTYLHLTMRAYMDRERRFLLAASRCLPQLFTITPPDEPRIPIFETMQNNGLAIPPHLILQPAVFDLRCMWHMHQQGLFTLSHATLFALAQQLLMQIAILHKNGIVHGDLRLANILVFLSPGTLSAVRFTLQRTTHYDGTITERILHIPFVSGFLGLVKLGDYGQARFVDRHDRTSERQQYDALETVLFQDLDDDTYGVTRRGFQRLRDQLLLTTDEYPRLTEYVKKK